MRQAAHPAARPERYNAAAWRARATVADRGSLSAFPMYQPARWRLWVSGATAVRDELAMEVTAELRGEHEFHQACAESVRRSLEDERQLRTQIDALAAKLATASASSAESGRIRARRRSAGAAAQAWLEQERTAAADITNRLTGLLDQQLRALGTFNVVLFGDRPEGGQAGTGDGPPHRPTAGRS